MNEHTHINKSDSCKEAECEGRVEGETGGKGG